MINTMNGDKKPDIKSAELRISFRFPADDQPGRLSESSEVFSLTRLLITRTIRHLDFQPLR